MKIVVLDRFAMGLDTPIEKLERFGEVEIYNSTNADDLVARATDADVLVLNKVRIDDKAFDSLPKLKLICIFATGLSGVHGNRCNFLSDYWWK